MTSHPSQVSAVLLMAGSGTRFGSSVPKQFQRLVGKKIYLHTLETFIASDLFAQIILVVPPFYLAEVLEETTPYSQTLVIPGGSTRQESSLLGLRACNHNTELVVIHDAVRPFVTLKMLQDNVAAAISHGAVDTCIPSADTLVHAPDSTQIASIPKRVEYLRGQTPQSFQLPLILEAHIQALSEGVENSSDDCSLVLRLGKPVHIVPGSEHNIKITTELDLFLAEQIFRMSPQSLMPSEHPLSLKGKRYAITGGTGGIGQILANRLEQEGAIPILISRSSSTHPADLTSFSETQAIFSKIEQEGPLDGLINSIGALKVKSLQELSSEEIKEQIDANLTAVIYSCKCAKLSSKSHIINIASSSYARGRKEFAIYASAKAAVVNFTQGLAEEHPHHFINALVPQRTQTAMRSENFGYENPITLLKPEEVAEEIIALLKQQSLTGAIVEVRTSSS